ncbi:MAG: hypothetical protein EA397_01250 [Deltaproteobacteria bacterium]|nr:MAG: hypothetical protein EA397_01250 [Deltaproteobacteria bacterium]
MRHFAAHAVDDRLLFLTWEEGLHLWSVLTSRLPGAVVCLMPNHVHVLAPEEGRGAIRGAMSSHARWLNHRRKLCGPLWRPLSDTGAILGREKWERNIRYVHLNPCRAGLVDDPLAWPLSTHRDLVGLTLRPVTPVRRDPAGFHRYVSSDPKVRVEGTMLPYNILEKPTFDELVDAVSALVRCTDDELRRKTSARRTLIRAAKSLTPLNNREIAEAVGVSRRTVENAAQLDPGGEKILRRVFGDRRFGLIVAEDGPRKGWKYRVNTADRGQRL